MDFVHSVIQKQIFSRTTSLKIQCIASNGNIGLRNELWLPSEHINYSTFQDGCCGFSVPLQTRAVLLSASQISCTYYKSQSQKMTFNNRPDQCPHNPLNGPCELTINHNLPYGKHRAGQHGNRDFQTGLQNKNTIQFSLHRCNYLIAASFDFIIEVISCFSFSVVYQLCRHELSFNCGQPYVHYLQLILQTPRCSHVMMHLSLDLQNSSESQTQVQHAKGFLSLNPHRRDRVTVLHQK